MHRSNGKDRLNCYHWWCTVLLWRCFPMAEPREAATTKWDKWMDDWMAGFPVPMHDVPAHREHHIRRRSQRMRRAREILLGRESFFLVCVWRRVARMPSTEHKDSFIHLIWQNSFAPSRALSPSVTKCLFWMRECECLPSFINIIWPTSWWMCAPFSNFRTWK